MKNAFANGELTVSGGRSGRMPVSVDRKPACEREADLCVAERGAGVLHCGDERLHIELGVVGTKNFVGGERDFYVFDFEVVARGHTEVEVEGIAGN